jgi:hypothetical protein
VVGVKDKHGTPVAIPGIELTDAFIRDIHTAVVQRVHHFPVYEVKPLPEAPDSVDNPKKGILLIIVPPSLNAPHAVSDPDLKGVLKFPYRHESQKFWMTERQIAAAYRRRYTTAVNSAQRAAEIESDVLLQFARALSYTPIPQPLLTVSLAPEMPGEFTITAAEVEQARKDVTSDELLLGRSPGYGFFTGLNVGSGRLIASGRCHGRTAWAHLHTDGAGSVVFPLDSKSGRGSTIAVLDAQIMAFVQGALRFLGQHAADRAGANGTARVTVRVLADVRVCSAIEPRLANAIDRLLQQGSQPVQPYDPQADVMPVTATLAYSGKEPARDAYGETIAFLDDLADNGRALVAATGDLAGALLQAYGMAEPRQIRPGGTLNVPAWEEYSEAVGEWAARADIPIA